MIKTTLFIAALLFLLMLFTSVLVGQASNKVTFCHAAGRDGTTHFVTLTTPYNAAFGVAGHFNEDGTPRAGHEQDYVGACVVDTPTPIITAAPTIDTTPTPTVTSTPSIEATPIATIGTAEVREPTALPNTGGSSK